jgi:hypothetical protein
LEWPYLTWASFLFSKVFLGKRERGDGSECPWRYYRGKMSWIKGNDYFGHPS